MKLRPLIGRLSIWCCDTTLATAVFWMSTREDPAGHHGDRLFDLGELSGSIETSTADPTVRTTVSFQRLSPENSAPTAYVPTGRAGPEAPVRARHRLSGRRRFQDS